MNADELKNADEIVRALRDYASDCDDCSDCLYCDFSCVCGKFDYNAPKIIADLIESLTAQLNGARANGLIQKHIIESGTNPLDADKIVRLTMDNVDLKRQLAASQRRAQDARNELCQKCGRYREAHKGACDGCRWTA